MKFYQGDLQFEVIDNTTNVRVSECLNKEIVEIDIPKNVKYNKVKYTITEIDNWVFEKCIRLETIKLPNTLTCIGVGAFAYCENLQKIKLPNSVTYIGSQCFSNCISLETIKLPNSLTCISDSAFHECESLKTIKLPNTLTEIGDYAFSYCETLKSINLPNTITKIGDYAFSYCESLQKINIPNSVKEIGVCAFCDTKIELPKRYTEDNKLIGYKGVKIKDNKLVCRDFEYTEGETYTINEKIQCCEIGFHACTNPLDVFNYYFGEIGKHIEIHEVYLGGEIDNDNKEDSKVCSTEITIGKKLTIEDINNLINE